MLTSACMTVLPPRMMFVVPMICDLRETLLPVSCALIRKLSLSQANGADVLFLCTRPLALFETLSTF